MVALIVLALIIEIEAHVEATLMTEGTGLFHIFHNFYDFSFHIKSIIYCHIDRSVSDFPFF